MYTSVVMYTSGVCVCVCVCLVCVCVCVTEDEMEPYQPPYWDLVPHATIENMKEVVCVQECRPSISAIWSSYMVRSGQELEHIG